MIIKLPNFFQDNKLNSLKAKMGIDRYTYGNFGNSQIQGIREILSGEGQDFEDISEITPLSDHTLTYNNERIIVYIRDVSNYGHYNLPRFHIAKCSTLRNMFTNNRKGRYVRTQNETGIFFVNIISGNKPIKKEVRLNVCKNCLDVLGWEGYSNTWTDAQKDACVARFTISNFFEKYPKFLSDDDGFSSTNSPVNIYPPNWTEISRNYKQGKNWTCEQCGVVLINNQGLLETNHKNGNKYECDDSNLEALCVDCHSKRPMHSHMLNNPMTRTRIEQVWKIKREQGIIVL